jgi:HEPN superfamily RiboL-PSP-like protein
MNFPAIENAITSWNARRIELAGLGFNATQLAEIENHVLRSVVLLMMSEYEDYIEKVFVKRAAKSNDQHIHRFFVKHMDRRFRNPNLGKINEMLDEMGGTYCQNFRDEVEVNNPQVKASWDSLLTARHAIVHKENAGVINLTWQDLEHAVIDTRLALKALSYALELTPADLLSL